MNPAMLIWSESMLELFEPEHLENIMVATGQLHRPCLMSYQKNLVLATCLKKIPQIPNFKQKTQSSQGGLEIPEILFL